MLYTVDFSVGCGVIQERAPDVVVSRVIVALFHTDCTFPVASFTNAYTVLSPSHPLSV